MSSWRDQVLKEFIPKVAPLTLVADPDGLILEERILEEIRERGFELIPYEDHIEFRYAYEANFRSHWDRGERTDRDVVLRSQVSDLNWLPGDLLHAGRKLSFNLGTIFPNLSYPVVSTLDRGDLDALYEASGQYASGRLGDNATKDFVLLHVFKIAPAVIKSSSDLLRVLLRRHYQGQRVPTMLDERFVQLLRQNTLFDDWPLEVVVPDRDVFFSFLQERWPTFLDHQAAKGGTGVCEGDTPYSLVYKGPVDLPYDHHDVRVYVDNLFVEGLLHAVSHKHADILSKTWVNIGILTAPIEDRSRRLDKLIETLEKSIPTIDTRHTDWFHYARGWAELVLLINEQPDAIPEDMRERANKLQVQVDAGFAAWLFRRYAGLVNLPPVPPVMLHHLPRFLARQILDDPNAKIALIVVDGLAMDQWLVMRNALASKQSDLRFREEAVFAWIPSLTSVSRQAVFSGKAPMYFPNSIGTTDKEPALWAQFWADQGLKPSEVVYIKGLGDGSMENVSEELSHPEARVVGMVVNKVDNIMHGMELGIAGMHSQVCQWVNQPYLRALLELLLNRGFRVYLTSDHGNIEAKGCGRPAEGAIAEYRGERVRIYLDSSLRSKVKERFPYALEWGTTGLPENYFVLLAPARQAFVQESQYNVSHGGISVEELIVPLIQIERRGK